MDTLYIGEAGPHHNYDVWMENRVSRAPVSPYRYNRGQDNADARTKRQVMVREVFGGYRVAAPIRDLRVDFIR